MAVETDEFLRKTSGTHVFLIVWKAYRALLAKADASKARIDLCDSDFRVLEALLHKGPLPVNVIGRKVELTTGSITIAIDRLEGKLLVARKNHATDRRIRIVELTAKGRRLIERGFAIHESHMEEAVKALSRVQRSTLVDLLKVVGGAPSTATSPHPQTMLQRQKDVPKDDQDEQAKPFKKAR